MKNEKKGSKHNPIKHGIFAEILLSGKAFDENVDDFHRLISMLRDSIRPAIGLEEALVEKLAVLLLRLTRVYKADVEIAPKLFARITEALKTDQPSVEAKWISRDDQVLVVRNNPSSDSIMRYETNLERQIGRTLDQIEQVRRMGGTIAKLREESRELEASANETLIAS